MGDMAELAVSETVDPYWDYEYEGKERDESPYPVECRPARSQIATVRTGNEVFLAVEMAPYRKAMRAVSAEGRARVRRRRD